MFVRLCRFLFRQRPEGQTWGQCDHRVRKGHVEGELQGVEDRLVRLGDDLVGDIRCDPHRNAQGHCGQYLDPTEAPVRCEEPVYNQALVVIS